MTTWQDVRAALVATLNEASQQIGNDAPLVVDEWPPESGELASPYAYVLPPERVSKLLPNDRVRERLEVIVRFLLEDESPRLAAQRMELWIEELKVRYQGDLVPAGAFLGDEPVFSAFSTYGPDGRPPYGFEVRFPVTVEYVAAARAA